MPVSFRQTSITLAAVVAAGAVALSAPGMSKAIFDAHNADKVDGYHANQLNKAQYFIQQTTFDNFDTCTFTTLMTRNFKTTHGGLVTVHSSVAAARDVGNAAEGILTTRVLIDGVVASLPASVNLENSGSLDGNSNNFGARKVASGTHILELQAKECGTGLAFITTQSMLASYSPFGGAAVAPDLRPVLKSQVNR